MKHYTLGAQAAFLTTAMTALLVACGGGGGGGQPTVSAASDQRAKALAVGVQPASSLPYYYVKQIPLPADGAAGSMGFDYWQMNGSGQLIGTYGDVNGNWLPFFYDGTASHRIDLPNFGEGVALNDAGVVVGYFSAGQGNYRPFKWSLAAGFVDFVGLGLLPDGSDVWGLAENGTISGNYPSGQTSQGYPNYQGFAIRPDGRIVDRIVAPQGQGFLALGWGLSPLGNVPGIGTIDGQISSSNLNLILKTDDSVVNAWSGSAAGYIEDPSNYNHIATDAGALITGARKCVNGYCEPTIVKTSPTSFEVISSTPATSLDNYMTGAGSKGGDAVGVSFADGNEHAWVYSESDQGTVKQSFDPGTNLYGINNHGIAVGTRVSLGPNGWVRGGAIWSRATGLVDLNTRLLGPDGQPLQGGTGAQPWIWSAFVISDAGHILADTGAGYVILVPSNLVYTPAAPLVAGIKGPTPVAVGTAANFSVAFSDGNAGDTHTAVWSWNDGSVDTSGQVSEAVAGSVVNGTASASHVFATPGVYKVSVKVTDSHGDTTIVTMDVVAYDPSAGFVTGGGWIMSPLGAYKSNASVTGRATFAFISKYKKGATIPTGTTEFQFRAASLDFRSDTYDWLVVAGARAQYKGVGLYNGQPGYKFMLTAVDGNLITKTGTPDRFRIKIWHQEDGADVVDYDNQTAVAGPEGSNTEGTVIGGGSIQIQK